MYLNTAPSGLRPWLYNPEVPVVGQAKLLGTDQVFQLLKHLIYHGFQLGRLCISKASLEWPEERGASQVHGNIGSTEELVHLISHSVKLADCELRIALDLGKQSP